MATPKAPSGIQMRFLVSRRDAQVPVWSGTPAPSFSEGTAASYSLVSFCADPSGGTLTFSSIGTALPSGVTINNSTRALDYDGVGAAASAAGVRLRASGAGGTADSAVFTVPVVANASPYPTTFDRYISPTGSDAANGLTPGTAWKTFNKAFTTMTPGTRLGLLNGTYSIAAGTGCMNFQGTGSAQIPSGTSLAAMTEVCAVNPGGAIIDGTGSYESAAVFIGRSTRKDSFIKLRGLKALTGINLYHSERCYIKECAAKYGVGIGTNDVSGGATLVNRYNLVEDCWAWGAGVRLLSANYQAHNNVWRRYVFRKDGGGPTGSGNPNVGFTVYNSKNVSVQNMFSVDRILGGEEPYGDFATAQHDGTNPDVANFYFGGNKWLGCASINSQDEAFHFEADTLQPGLVSWTLQNCVALPGGLNMSAATFGPPNSSAVIENFTALYGQLRVRELDVASIVRNCIIANSGTFGMNGNGALTVSYVDTFNNTGGNNIAISNPFTFNPLAGSPASLLYPLRIEAGSLAKGVGFGGGDLGANIVYRYGLDGTFQGDPGFDTLTTTPLWPYPNEARIKADMAADSTRGFCAPSETFTHYVWNFLGNGSPY